ncbi:VCBS repeat-containing protein [Glycomyces luteolus]|uniref:VCBS repeat-containing protein n=1 Tax=Glycomyces luteolus TaxID=2670330 RepID=A0A9X3PGK8_9ACTN|nr:VCBS repeat-containing protein [Glycomyces luteolus]MDA1362224.1 VCBS repeat-containing protein [Glycomyces luteolus]
MNRTLPPKRLAPKRIAAATAAAVSAALLTYPGAATAQTTAIDCAALGETPTASGLESALDTADQCQVEVRIQNRSSPYATVYATPQHQLHYVATAAPVQEYDTLGKPDATITAADGVLVATSTDWPFTFPDDGPADLPLIDTPYAEVVWNGETPLPTYAGTTAVYDELAPGLDFSVDLDVASAGLLFTAADAAAWSHLAGGLTLKSDGDIRVGAGGWITVLAETTERPSARVESTTPFALRDAAGAAIDISLSADAETGRLAITAPEDAVANAAFPLQLTTQWTYDNFPVPTWGSVTSAVEDLSVFRGESGYDEPYFEAAGETGDALAGPYCDGFTDETCATQAQARSYWSFPWAMIHNLRATASQGFEYPVASASFQVDAAEGTQCVAPGLHRIADYRPQYTWSYSSDAIGSATSGGCQDGTAAYDVSALVDRVWNNNSYHQFPAAFTMPDSPETARFDGDSARLDVYFDIVAYIFSIPSSTCSTSSSTPAYYRGAVTTLGGNQQIDTWRPDLIDLELTWSAKVYDVNSGELLVATEPQAAPDLHRPSVQLPPEDVLGQGLYRAEYTVDSSAVDHTRIKTCYFAVDAAAPEIIGVEPDPGPYYIGDTVSVDVDVADEGFPNGWGDLNVSCYGGELCEGAEEIVLDDETTATFEFELEDSFGSAMFQVKDDSGQFDWSSFVDLRATPNTYDYNGDRYQDLYLVRLSDGHLLYYPGNGTGKLGTPVDKGADWGKMDIVMAGDLTEDGIPDLLARDAKNGNLWTYPGNGSGGFASRRFVGNGWNAISSFTSAGDFNGDGRFDLYGLRKSDGKLFFYPGKGDGTFDSRIEVAPPTGGYGWGRYDSVTTIAPTGNGDTQPDLYFHHSEGIRSSTVETESDGTVANSTSHQSIGGKRADGSWAEFTQLTAVGDQNSDGNEEFIAVDARTGELLLHGEMGGAITSTVLSKFGGGFRLPAITVDSAYDYNGDTAADLYGIRSSNSELRFYPGNGSGGFRSTQNLGVLLDAATLVETAGDFNGDGKPDLLTRDVTGALTMIGGDGDGWFFYAPQITTGTGWNSMSAIASGHDYNGDGKIDLIAREKSTGYLWLYPGKGNGYVGTRVKIGTGWNAMREITAAGDLDHDGLADVLAIRSSDNCMYFYGGRGNGTLKAGVKMSCNWVGYDSVAAVGDFNGDGHADWVARRKSDGALYLYKGNGAGGYSARALIGTGWNSIKFIA